MSHVLVLHCFYTFFEFAQNDILPVLYHHALTITLCMFVCSVQFSILTTFLVRECNVCILESNVPKMQWDTYGYIVDISLVFKSCLKSVLSGDPPAIRFVHPGGG